jgi:hypothetical protein
MLLGRPPFRAEAAPVAGLGTAGGGWAMTVTAFGRQNMPRPTPPHSKYRSPLTLPSFFPELSSSSTPTHSPIWKLVRPRNRIVAVRPSVRRTVWPSARPSRSDMVAEVYRIAVVVLDQRRNVGGASVSKQEVDGRCTRQLDSLTRQECRTGAICGSVDQSSMIPARQVLERSEPATLQDPDSKLHNYYIPAGTYTKILYAWTTIGFNKQAHVLCMQFPHRCCLSSSCQLLCQLRVCQCQSVSYAETLTGALSAFFWASSLSRGN